VTPKLLYFSIRNYRRNSQVKPQFYTMKYQESQSDSDLTLVTKKTLNVSSQHIEPYKSENGHNITWYTCLMGQIK
jgi:hypothetical protein